MTYRSLAGISPYGAITFLSGLYDGSISNVENDKIWDSEQSSGVTNSQQIHNNL